MSDEVEDLLREVRRSRGEPDPVPAGDPAAPPQAPPAPSPGGSPDAGGERFDAQALERAARAVEAAAAPRPE